MAYTRWLLVIILLAVAIPGASYKWYLKNRATYKLNPAVLFGVFFGFVAGILLVHAIVYFKDYPTEVYGELASLSGASLGWLFGMWLSPLGSTESTKFSRYGTAVAGIGSGFTLKWAMERVSEASPWIKGHPSVCLLFGVSLLVTTAAVYNSRAYEKSLTISLREPRLNTTTTKDDVVVVEKTTVAVFYAACVGPSDPLAYWEVFPIQIGSIDANGVFTAGSEAGEGRITAFNVEDPTLSNYIKIRVV